MEEEATNQPRILLGGLPFGRGSIGDEAVAESVVAIIRELCPAAEIFVSTDQEAATRKRLSVQTCPLIGFPNSKLPQEKIRQIVREKDVVIWAGTFGLSDDPVEGLSLLDFAQQEGSRTVIFCAGNDTTSAPITQSRTRKALFGTLRFLTAGIMDLKAESDAKRNAALVDLANRVIPKADLVILRDNGTANALDAIVKASEPWRIGADPLVSLTCQDIDTCRFPRDTMEFLERSDFKIALSISSDCPARVLTEIKTTLDFLISNQKVKVLGLPLNPAIEIPILTELRNNLELPSSMLVLAGNYDPDEIMAAGSRVDVVISNQRDLLVFAANTLTPFVNIGNQSSSTSFAEKFQLQSFGRGNDGNSGGLREEVVRLRDERKTFRKKAIEVRLDMLARLKAAKQSLGEALNQ